MLDKVDVSRREFLGAMPAIGAAAAVEGTTGTLILTPKQRLWVLHALPLMVIDWHNLMAVLHDGGHNAPFYWKIDGLRPDVDQSLEGSLRRARYSYTYR